MVTFLLISLVVAIVVMIHYEFLYRFTRLVPHLKIPHRFRVLSSAFAAVIAHAIEIVVFAVAYYYFHKTAELGA